MKELELLAGLKELERISPDCEADHDISKNEVVTRWDMREAVSLLRNGSLVLLSRRRLRQIIKLLGEAFIDVREPPTGTAEAAAKATDYLYARSRTTPPDTRTFADSTSANSHMVGGNHYRETVGEQHWDRIWRLYGRGYFVGCVTKYCERYHLKDGLKDLQKARHFLDKLIELETAKLEANNEGSLDNAKR